MHLILAGTAVQASFFAAALKLPADAWEFCAETTQLQRRPVTALHLLPGASHAIAGAALGLATLQDVPIYQLP